MNDQERESAFWAAVQALAVEHQVNLKASMRVEKHGEKLEILPWIEVSALPMSSDKSHSVGSSEERVERINKARVLGWSVRNVNENPDDPCHVLYKPTGEAYDVQQFESGSTIEAAWDTLPDNFEDID
ncbi:MAG: hypothetical protein K8L99_26225 [Anaerolineae bacterium]|nr:hypothetical protein [Anaerolineae bacterium]